MAESDALLAVLEISRPAYDDIVHRASESAEREVCGILAGEYDDDCSVVVDAYPTENVAETPEIRYSIDPEEQFEITEAIEDEGFDVVGFYHSHPAGPTHPSETDADRATWPGFSYVIVALDGYPFAGSWRWRGDADGFEQELVRVVDEDPHSPANGRR